MPELAPVATEADGFRLGYQHFGYRWLAQYMVERLRYRVVPVKERRAAN